MGSTHERKSLLFVDHSLFIENPPPLSLTEGKNENGIVTSLKADLCALSCACTRESGDGAGYRSAPGRPTNVDNSRARAYCACSGCGLGL